MTAISKAFVVIADTAVDPDSPIDSTLMTGLRDNDVHLREWLGYSFEAGAVQDHNHDGTNSALVPVGPNLLRNGSFENGGLAGWLQTVFGGGTIALNNTAADLNNGIASAAITSTVLANGGGSLQSSEYVPVSGGQSYSVSGDVMASVANVSGKIEVVWFDVNKAQISVSTAYTSANLPTAFTNVGNQVTAPTAARFMRVLLTGGIPTVGTAFGTVYFDGLVLGVPVAGLLRVSTIVTSGTFTPLPSTKQIIVTLVGGGGGGSYNGNAGGGSRGSYAKYNINSPLATSYPVTIGAGGAAGNGVEGSNGGATSFGAYTATGGIGAGMSGASVVNAQAGVAQSGANSGAGGQTTNNGYSGVIYVEEYA